MSIERLQVAVEQHAACAGQSDLMEGSTRIDRLKAARICQGCPVREQCDALATALVRSRRPVSGVWAGKMHGLMRGRPQVIRPTLRLEQHGTRAAYEQGCGCSVCLDGEAERSAARRAARRSA